MCSKALCVAPSQARSPTRRVTRTTAHRSRRPISQRPTLHAPHKRPSGFPFTPGTQPLSEAGAEAGRAKPAQLAGLEAFRVKPAGRLDTGPSRRTRTRTASGSSRSCRALPGLTPCPPPGPRALRRPAPGPAPISTLRRRPARCCGTAAAAAVEGREGRRAPLGEYCAGCAVAGRGPRTPGSLGC